MDRETYPPWSEPVDQSDQLGWQLDQVMTRSGVVVPVRATARRPTWSDLPSSVHELGLRAAGSRVVGAGSTGTGFTPGFASRLTLADGRHIFVKAASSADDEKHGWPLSEAYSDEARKLTLLPPGIGAPALLWHHDVDLDGRRWVILGFEYIAGTPPRRPWRVDQLRLVLDKLASTAEALRQPTPGLRLEDLGEHLIGGVVERFTRIRASGGESPWVDLADRLCQEAEPWISGNSIVHMDLRDDNVLMATDGNVWFVDWNWPVRGADWVDSVCIVLSAQGDGLDGDTVLTEHTLTRNVDPHGVNCLLAVLWSYWTVAQNQPVPYGSPHLRDHQAWYADVTREWLASRLASR